MSSVVEKARSTVPANEVTLGDVMATKSELLQRAASLTASLQDATPEQLAEINSRFSAALRAMNEEPADPKIAPVQSVDVIAKYGIAKYGFQILEDGFVRFTAVGSYLHLFLDAQAYCADPKNDRSRPAIYEGSLEWFAKRADATRTLEHPETHEIRGVVRHSKGKNRDEQTDLLKEKGLTWPTLEATVAAEVLYYCATGRTDLFGETWVRTAAPGLELYSLGNGLHVCVSRYDDSRQDNVGAAGVRNQKS